MAIITIKSVSLVGVSKFVRAFAFDEDKMGVHQAIMETPEYKELSKLTDMSQYDKDVCAMDYEIKFESIRHKHHPLNNQTLRQQVWYTTLEIVKEEKIKLEPIEIKVPRIKVESYTRELDFGRQYRSLHANKITKSKNYTGMAVGALAAVGLEVLAEDSNAASIVAAAAGAGLGALAVSNAADMMDDNLANSALLGLYTMSAGIMFGRITAVLTADKEVEQVSAEYADEL
ncbi:hypothetical protein PQC07_gp065 [Aeromonas phage D3]|uniref:Uncharacterized protein n=1 Tax=Aeromonas phage D3 TaxID=2593327 RepID=A0A514TVE3_9CAUD|nr:hypothetical protein PQC07_gp065 [Aeromonas phage D3]QDJ96940.1 hypothetical protein D3_0210 [Aeromonas phage D3]QEP52246.1 hypothetical protein D9_0039 [Aeromonas phage D9]